MQYIPCPLMPERKGLQFIECLSCTLLHNNFYRMGLSIFCKYWSRQLFPSPRSLPNPGIKPRSPTLQADSSPGKPPRKLKYGNSLTSVRLLVQEHTFAVRALSLQNLNHFPFPVRKKFRRKQQITKIIHFQQRLEMMIWAESKGNSDKRKKEQAKDK